LFLAKFLWLRYVPRMARPLRIEFPGAIHHVMARGNARQAIFLNDEDRDAYESGHRQLPQIGVHFG